MSNKEILTLEEVNSFIEYLKTFIYDIEVCSNNIEQIINAQNEGVNLIPIQHFIGHYIFLSYSNCAINAYKIYQKDEKRSFFKLFNKIDNFSYDITLKNYLKNNEEKGEDLIKNRKEFKNLTAELSKKINEKTDLVDKIKQRRLTFYAHSDPAGKAKVETLADIKELKDFSKGIFNVFYGKFKDISFLFNNNIVSINSVIEDRKFVALYYENLEKEI